MADTKALAIYFAGFFDGEGCVAIYERKYVTSLTNTDLRPLVLARDLWGGAISCQAKATRPGAVQDLYRWQLYGHRARTFLETIRPFTLVKGDQIDVFLAVLKVLPVLRGSRRARGAAAVIQAGAAQLRLLKREA